MSFYLDSIQDQKRGLKLGEKVLAGLEGYSSEVLKGPTGVELVGAIDNIGKRQLLLRRYAEAEASYQKALDLLKGEIILEDKQKSLLCAGIYHQLGIVAEEQRKWKLAEQYYKQALEIKIEAEDRYSQASTYHQLGMVAEKQRKWELAEQYYKQALEIKTVFYDQYSQASTYHQLGRVAQEQKKWEQAELYYKHALEIFIEFNDGYSQAGTCQQLGRVAHEQQNWEQAEHYYKQALEIFIEFDDRYSQAGTYHQLGMAAQEQQNWEQAELYYKQALEIFIEFDDWYSQAGTYQQLGLVSLHTEKNKLIESVTWLGKAYYIAVENNMPLVDQVIVNIARTMKDMGEDVFVLTWTDVFNGLEPPQRIIYIFELFEEVFAWS